MTVPAVAAPHPLADLSGAEFTKARDAIVKVYKADQSLFFRSIYRWEPAKDELLPFLEAEHAGTLSDATPRPARIAAVEYEVIDGTKQVFHRAGVNISTGEVVSNEPIPSKNKGFPHFNV